MIRKSFIGLTTPRFEYQILTGALPEPEAIPAPPSATLLIEEAYDRRDPEMLKSGDRVKAGQKIEVSSESRAYAVATVDGTIAAVDSYAGDFGRVYTAVSIATEGEAGVQVEEALAESSQLPALDTAADYLACVPGSPPLRQFQDPERTFHTLVIYGGDTDLLVATNQYVVRTRIDALKTGIGVLKQITGIDKVIVAVPGELLQGYGHIGAEVKNVSTVYPSALPAMIMKDVLGQVVPAGRSPEDLGVCFITAEAAAALGQVYETGVYPVRKLITVVDKANQWKMVSAVIGTPIGEIFQRLNIALEDRDRIIVGGPMTGSAIFSEAHPVTPETSALMVQASGDIPYVSDYPCINCGECNRICPVDIPINMLVRFLEAGRYEDSADQYDLYSCIECGLCSFVCPSKIPIFQYIRLAKYELERLKSAEEANE